MEEDELKFRNKTKFRNVGNRSIETGTFAHYEINGEVVRR
jgi:hypothetical protein